MLSRKVLSLTKPKGMNRNSSAITLHWWRWLLKKVPCTLSYSDQLSKYRDEYDVETNNQKGWILKNRNMNWVKTPYIIVVSSVSRVDWDIKFISPQNSLGIVQQDSWCNGCTRFAKIISRFNPNSRYYYKQYLLYLNTCIRS